MAYIIATETYAQSIGGVPISYISNLGCTKSRAIALGCDVAGTYTDNQLVRKEDLSKKTITLQYALKNISSDYLTNVRIQAGSCVFAGNLPVDSVLYTTTAPSGKSWTITINGSTSTTYMVYPTPHFSCHDYYLDINTYRFDIAISSASNLQSGQTRIFMLSNMDNTLVGTKLQVNGDHIRTIVNSGHAGQLVGRTCYNKDGSIIMINGNNYSVLYTIVTDYGLTGTPIGNMVIDWQRIHEFKFQSDKYYYSFNLSV